MLNVYLSPLMSYLSIHNYVTSYRMLKLHHLNFRFTDARRHKSLNVTLRHKPKQKCTEISRSCGSAEDTQNNTDLKSHTTIILYFNASVWSLKK